eukprot:gene20901-15413_t
MQNDLSYGETTTSRHKRNTSRIRGTLQSHVLGSRSAAVPQLGFPPNSPGSQ